MKFLTITIMHDDYDCSEDWGCNEDSGYGMSEDYSTDTYEDSYYSDADADCDMDWDETLDADFDVGAGGAFDSRPNYYSPPSFRTHAVKPVVPDGQYERQIPQLEAMIAAALTMAAFFEAKSANASTSKKIRKYKRRTVEKQEEADSLRKELDRLSTDYESVKLESESARTRVVVKVCVAVGAISVLAALLY